MVVSSVLAPIPHDFHNSPMHVRMLILHRSDSGPRSLDRTKEKLISRMPSDEKPWMEMYAILLRPSGAEPATFIGAMGIIRLSEDEEAAEVGYGILPDHRGKGYAPEALKLLADYYWTSESRPHPTACFVDDEQRKG